MLEIIVSSFLSTVSKLNQVISQRVLSSESSALSWGKELFEYYIEGSRRVSSMDSVENS